MARDMTISMLLVLLIPSFVLLLGDNLFVDGSAATSLTIFAISTSSATDAALLFPSLLLFGFKS